MTVTKHKMNGVDLEILEKTIKTVQDNPKMGQCQFRITNKWVDADHNFSTVDNFYAAGEENTHRQPFKIDADEPAMLAGEDQAPNPVEHLLNALAACLTTSLVSHAALEGIKIDQLESEVQGDLDLRGYLGISPNVRKGFNNIQVKFKVKTDAENMKKLRDFTRFSPVFDVVSNGTEVNIQVDKK